MPEVVEVNVTAQWLHKTLKGKILNKINIISGRYTHQTLEGKNLIKKSKVLKVRSKGKFLWFELDDYYIFNTFGLSGNWTEDDDNNNRLEFIFDNKTLYFNDPRNFGTIKIVKDKSILDKKIKDLADDALTSDYDHKYIKNRINILINKNKDKELVKILMDQTTRGGILSGIGNYLAAEILYAAKLSPKRKLSSLDDIDIKKLTKAIKIIIKKSYQDTLNDFKIKGKDYHKYVITSPKFRFKVYKQEKDPKGNKVTSEEIVNGRTTYWVKNVQI